MLIRRGATLVELLVSMTLAAVVLGAASVTLVRQRRDSDGQASRVRAEAQVRAALGELQVAFEGLSPAAGDLVPGEIRDTAVQLRTAIASAIACDSTAGQVTVSASDSSGQRVSGIAAAPKIGDTLWWRTPGAPGAPSWVARRVADVSASTGSCAVTGPDAQALLHIVFAVPDSVPRGAPLRLTRSTRYSFYHAGDGSWQLGISEWSDILHAFAPPQPVAGPFVLVAPDGTRTGFRYFNAAGSELHAEEQGFNPADIARVRITLVAVERSTGPATATFRRDSVDVALAHAP